VETLKLCFAQHPTFSSRVFVCISPSESDYQLKASDLFPSALIYAPSQDGDLATLYKHMKAIIESKGASATILLFARQVSDGDEEVHHGCLFAAMAALFGLVWIVALSPSTLTFESLASSSWHEQSFVQKSDAELGDTVKLLIKARRAIARRFPTVPEYIDASSRHPYEMPSGLTRTCSRVSSCIERRNQAILSRRIHSHS
jgi:hypothetical protein